MTEQEWLSSTDPARMLDYLVRRNPISGTTAGEKMGNRVSDRQLRLFAWNVHDTACHYRGATNRYAENDLTITHWHNHGLSTEFQLEYSRARPLEAKAWLEGLIKNEVSVAFLRDLIGNPFRPVTLPKSLEKCKGCAGRGWRANTSGSGPVFENCLSCKKGWAITGSCPWLTPSVLAIARAAYEERVSGLLDPDRLAVLADALEDAGCPAEEACPECKGRGLVYRRSIAPWSGDYVCEACEEGRIPHHLLAHLRGPGPHVRGCHVLDCFLGLS